MSFALAGDNGRLKILDATTDSRGVAETEYRAGSLIGTVMVTAASSDYGVTAAVQITLMSGAPAKIDLVASAVSLPADGESTATLAMRVTDIHDNPNSEVPVTLAILAGIGALSTGELLTDRNGEGSAIYTAGNRAGTTVIEARHTSRAPTADELRRIYGTVFVPRLVERQERERLKVAEWLVEAGDEVLKGQPLVTLETRAPPPGHSPPPRPASSCARSGTAATGWDWATPWGTLRSMRTSGLTNTPTNSATPIPQ